MIRTESEYRNARARLTAEQHRLDEHKKRLQEAALTEAQIKRALDPILSVHFQLREEVESYERIRRGDFQEVEDFIGLGRVLIGLRIYLGLSQRELARRLSVDESQVSRDERNEYRGVTVERVNEILVAMGAHMKTRIEPPQPILSGQPE
jgi:Helix-turn-helix domain